MKAVGLIVEYNPLHNGHIYHIEQARLKSNADIVIAVMSGNFLQRGEPAIVDKFTRAKMAVEQNVDLVFELPTVYAIQHSDIFAHASIRMLNELQVDQIVFGSEAGEIEPFHLVWELIEKNQQHYQKVLKQHLNQGNSYSQANIESIKTLDPKVALDFTKPNNILGFSYLKAQKKINKRLKLTAIKRIKADYHSQELSYPITSATSIRTHLTNDLEHFNHHELAIPFESYDLLQNYISKSGTFHNWESYFPLLKYRIISDSKEQLQKIHGITEGIENRLKEKVVESNTFAQFIEKVQTKRYTKARLQRLAVHILLQLTKEQVTDQLEQVDQINEFRLLAMTNKGQKYLNQLKKTKNLRIISQLKRKLSSSLSIDEQATRIYYLPLNDIKQAQLRKQELMPPYKTKL